MTTTINLTGPVIGNDSSWIYDYLEIDCINLNKINEALKDEAEELIINLSSNGGEVTAASEIYTILRQATASIKINILGMAASAASVIAMAGDEINISPTARMMIHQASIVDTGGNTDDLTHMADVLAVTDQSIAQAYIDKTGLSEESILNLMSKETFFSAKQAVENGFADNIMFAEEKVINNIGNGSLSNNVINKVGTLLATNKTIENNSNESSRLAQKSAKAAILLEEFHGKNN